ncbi:MAG: cytochrome c3 family protein [Thermodesulfobacteriota bacterium]|nr:cytochrome c3 family protein [Thermodesulfobacteriota bacterium]
MKNLAFVVLAVVFSFIPVFLAQQNGIKAPITKVEVLEEGVYKYEGDTKGNVYFDHNMHQEMGDCEDCHEGEPAKIEIIDMASGHETCGMCHDEVDDMDACSACHSK